MSYTALYRKFRPATFEDVKGQDHIVTTLVNQLKANRIGHAYLFTGTRGTGKTSVAKIFARAVNCENPVNGNPCGECATCKAIASGASMNVMEIDAASNNGVDNIRDIVEEVSYSPAQGKYKVYIIDEVHMLSIGAFNALLKTLEEPPSYVIFILATTEVHKIPITILSRCQRYDFRRIGIDVIADRLKELVDKEGVNVEEKALKYVAKAADGSMRDALSLLDQCIAFHLGKDLTYDMVLDVLGAVDTAVFSRMFKYIVQRDVASLVKQLEEVVMQGRELTQFVIDFTWYLRNLMMVKSTEHAEDLLDVSTDNYKLIKEDAGIADIESIMRYIRVFSELSTSIRYSSSKRILIEIALIKLCKPEMEVTNDALVDRIKNVEEKLEKGIVVNAGTVQAGPEAGAPEAPKPVTKAPLPSAIPDDIMRIVERWNSVVGNAYGQLKAVLAQSYPSLGENNSLIIAAADIYSEHYFGDDEHKKDFENLLEEITGKHVNVEYRTSASNAERDMKYPNLLECINMEVEVES
ncbi:MAG: DNA polymerase III subunit gamma/tau [Lachnospiraceae bacterium]|nr:DNA polymerase III subunit gamma/tau [Lachnospiraceae bacterium]MBR4993415.1 DNA polymerase III subunit gamma/tau [Lachnospiraceae bacterium]